MATPSLATLRYLRLLETFGAKGECYLPSALYTQNSSNICLFVCFSILFEFVKNVFILIKKQTCALFSSDLSSKYSFFLLFFAILGF